jgi:hypothetical protein
MFFEFTNIYNKKTIGSILMEFFTATGNLKKFFWQLEMFDVCNHGWLGTHRYDIQVLATHAPTWVHRYYSLLQWSVPLVKNLNTVPVCAVSPVVNTSNISICEKKNFFLSFPVAVNNSINLLKSKTYFIYHQV